VMDGYTFLRILRQRLKTPVLALSSITDSADIELALELGADEFMTKPFSPRKMRAKLEQVLGPAEPS